MRGAAGPSDMTTRGSVAFGNTGGERSCRVGSGGGRHAVRRCGARRCPPTARMAPAIRPKPNQPISSVATIAPRIANAVDTSLKFVRMGKIHSAKLSLLVRRRGEDVSGSEQETSGTRHIISKVPIRVGAIRLSQGRIFLDGFFCRWAMTAAGGCE